MADVAVEERFPYGKPLIGRARGGFVVGDDLRIEHPLLRTAAVVPLSRVAAVVRQDESEPEPDLPVLRRELRRLDLGSGAAAGDRVAVVLFPAARIGPFRYGADRALTISRRERKQGIDVDVVESTFDDAEGLVAALAGRGVGVQATLAGAVRLVSEEATGPELDTRLQQRAAQRRRASLLFAGMGVLTSALLAGRMALACDESFSSAGRVALAGPAWALLLGAAALALLRRGGRRPLSAGWRLGLTLSAVVLAPAALIAVMALSRRLIGPLYVVALSFLGGLSGAYLFYLAGRARGGDRAPAGPPLDPAAQERPAAVRRALAMAAVGAAVLAWAADGEPGRLSDLAVVRRAVVTEDALPAGWEETFAPGVYRGSDLEGHVCGAPKGLLPALTAGYDREFSELLPDGSERAHLVVAVFATAGEDVATREFAAVESRSYSPCASRNVAESALAGFVHAHAGTTTFHRSPLPGAGNSGVLDQFATTVVHDDGRTGTVFTSMVRLRVGRLIVRMPFTSYEGRPYDEAEVVAVARTVARRAAAAGA